MVIYVNIYTTTTIDCVRTSYDAFTRQYWLSVYRHKLLARFLLKDPYLQPLPYHHDEVHQAKVVDRMIAAVNDMKQRGGGKVHKDTKEVS
jgi:hypothetical protein